MNWKVQTQLVKTSMLTLYSLQHPSQEFPGLWNILLIFSVPHRPSPICCSFFFVVSQIQKSAFKTWEHRSIQEYKDVFSFVLSSVSNNFSHSTFSFNVRRLY